MAVNLFEAAKEYNQGFSGACEFTRGITGVQLMPDSTEENTPHLRHGAKAARQTVSEAGIRYRKSWDLQVDPLSWNG